MTDSKKDFRIRFCDFDFCNLAGTLSFSGMGFSVRWSVDLIEHDVYSGAKKLRKRGQVSFVCDLSVLDFVHGTHKTKLSGR